MGGVSPLGRAFGTLSMLIGQIKFKRENKNDSSEPVLATWIALTKNKNVKFL